MSVFTSIACTISSSAKIYIGNDSTENQLYIHFKRNWIESVPTGQNTDFSQVDDTCMMVVPKLGTDPDCLCTKSEAKTIDFQYISGHADCSVGWCEGSKRLEQPHWLIKISNLKSDDAFELTLRLMHFCTSAQKGTAALQIYHFGFGQPPFVLEESPPVLITKCPPLAVTEFACYPAQIDFGYPYQLVWKTSGANSCFVDSSAVGLTGSLPGRALMSVKHKIMIRNQYGKLAMQTAQPNINPPQIVNFHSDRFCYSPQDSVTIVWDVKSAKEVTINPMIGSLGGNTCGKKTMTLPSSRRFTLSASGYYDNKPMTVTASFNIIISKGWKRIGDCQNISSARNVLNNRIWKHNEAFFLFDEKDILISNDLRSWSTYVWDVIPKHTYDRTQCTGTIFESDEGPVFALLSMENKETQTADGYYYQFKDDHLDFHCSYESDNVGGICCAAKDSLFYVGVNRHEKLVVSWIKRPTPLACPIPVKDDLIAVDAIVMNARLYLAALQKSDHRITIYSAGNLEDAAHLKWVKEVTYVNYFEKWFKLIPLMEPAILTEDGILIHRTRENVRYPFELGDRIPWVFQDENKIVLLTKPRGETTMQAWQYVIEK